MSDWSEVTRPIPVPDQWTQPFWDAAKRGVLELQRCQSCGHFQHPSPLRWPRRGQRPCARVTSFWPGSRSGRNGAPCPCLIAPGAAPPYPTCLNCMGIDLKFEPVGGTGTIYAYTYMHHTGDKRFAPAVPYASIVVELDGAPGALMAGNLL